MLQFGMLYYNGCIALVLGSIRAEMLHIRELRVCFIGRVCQRIFKHL